MPSSNTFSKSLSLWSLPTLALPTLALAALCLTGCSKEAAEPVVGEEVVEEVDVPGLESSDSPDPNAASDTTEADEITAAMAELSPADRAAAMAQKICPVSDHPLGSMGTPIKASADGHDAFLCCAGCKDKFEADPKKYLAKLDTAQPNTTQ